MNQKDHDQINKLGFNLGTMHSNKSQKSSHYTTDWILEAQIIYLLVGLFFHFAEILQFLNPIKS